MSLDLHERARRLAAASRVEDVPEPDRAWLQEHLARCAACESFVQRLGDALRALRLPEVRVEPWLLGLTQRRLRARALADESPPRALVVATVAGFPSATAVAWGLWLLLQSWGEGMGLPLSARVALAILLWFLPASGLALAAIVLRTRIPRGSAIPLPAEVGS
jgi:hypothetical protein